MKTLFKLMIVVFAFVYWLSPLDCIPAIAIDDAAVVMGSLFLASR